jgi:hypothetical protein
MQASPSTIFGSSENFVVVSRASETDESIERPRLKVGDGPRKGTTVAFPPK